VERKRLGKEPEAETPLPHLDRASSMPASTARMRDVLKRYGLALALASLALVIRAALPIPEGTAIYQLPIVAVVLSGWFGGRGPGLFASLICAATILYRFIPPANSFELTSDYALGFLIFIALCLLLSEFSSARRRAERARRASEERFHALVQFSFDVYWETDAEHRFTRQEFSERLTDAPARGAEIGKTRWEIPYVEPDEEAWRKHRATLDAHLPFRDFELARPTADGGTRYVSVSGIPAFDEIGRFVGYRGVGRHITERKRAEAEHQSYLRFLESMDRINRTMQGTQDLQQMLSDVLLVTLDIFACDRAWLIYPCDPDAPFWHAVMEHTRPQFPGAFALEAELPVDRDVAAAFAAARAAPGAVLFGPDYDLKIPALAADRFAVRSQMAMAIDAKADKPYLFGLHQCSRARVWTADEQRLFQEIGRRLSDAISALSFLRSLRDTRTELERMSRLTTLGELTTSIAHEVSQPLGAMVASAGACARWLGADPPAMAEARSALDNIVADGKRAREVIARIRALTKRQVPRMDSLDLNRKILDVLALTEHELRSHDIVLETTLDRTLPHVTGDRVQLQQVLLNLIVNAIEAMSAVNNRPRELTIVTAQGTDGVAVEVRDSGIGLDPDRAERVFEAFYTTKAEGIGIGLSISRSIVEAHGGRLWATPNEPHGTVFRFSLPGAEDRKA
jgi:PAS domain S-box-containing protein